MKLRVVLMLTVIASLAVPVLATAGWRHLDTSDIEVDIIGDGSYRPLARYPLEDSHRLYRGYLEAKEGRGYEIRVRNKSDQRIGVVISVDGRNIISGASSDLDNDERMYVLGPYETGTYRGWRTGRNRVNRFYFTDAPDSFAGRWGDYSDMGIVAVAAYVDRYEEDSVNKFRSRKPGSKGPGVARSRRVMPLTATRRGRESATVNDRLRAGWSSIRHASPLPV